jgi:NTP pyrophosphatase (non-canonical NTP hydrolase)
MEILEVLEVLVKECHANSYEHGFWVDYSRIRELLGTLDPGSVNTYVVDTKLHKIALMMSELGEAVEGIRKPHLDGHCPKFTSEEVELADTLIRIFDYCGKFNLRIGEAVLAKMEYNKTRPYMHGKEA